MYQQSILLPFYCNNCNHLAFVYHAESKTENNVIEFAESIWRIHRCFSLKGSTIWNQEKDPSTITWGAEEVPLDRTRQIKRLKTNDLTFGVVVRLPPKEEQDGFLEVLTVENNLVLLRTLESQDNLSAGMLLNLHDAQKVGKNKFRMPAIRQYLLPDFESSNTELNTQNLSLKLSALDQEQLEAFISQFTMDLSKANLFPISITPLKIGNVPAETCYHRKLILPPAYNLKKTIESMAIPDSIKIAVI